MSRRRIRLREQPTGTANYAGMSKLELAALAREKGIKGVPESWYRETIIKKLEAL